MTTLEMKVEALMRCVDQTKLEAAMKELNFAAHAKDNLPGEIRTHLTTIGVPAHLIGHRYLAYAVELAVTDENIMDAITSKLYPAVAKRFDTTLYRVERAIRHAVEVAWSRGDMDTLLSYFGNTISLEKGKPTNGEFISQLANIIRDWRM